jgi:hypothetical protein
MVDSYPMHSVVEQRSLHYHAAIAARLMIDDQILPRIRARVDEWISKGTVARFYAEGWKEILARPLPELLAFLCDGSQHARAFRQVSPFAGVLSPRERWQIWAKTSTSDDPTAA